MTIGIALTLPDGVLLVADGKLTYPLVSNMPPINDVDKLEQISPTIYAISFGITIATDFSLDLLKKSFTKNCTPEKLSLSIELFTRSGFRYLINHLPENIDINNIRMKAGLIAGGILSEETFITGSLCGTNFTNSPILFKNSPYKIFMLGGEEQKAFELFTHKVLRVVESILWDNNIGPINPTVRGLLDASLSTIRIVESQSSEIGGSIRYVVIRKGFSVQKSIL